MDAAWRTFRAGEVPPLEVPWMTRAMAQLAAAVHRRDDLQTRQAAIDAEQRIIDLQLPYRQPVAINLARMQLWTEQLLVDAAAKDASAVNGDVFTLFYMRDRILGVLAPEQRTAINVLIDRLQVAGADRDVVRAATAAAKLREVISGIEATLSTG